MLNLELSQSGPYVSNDILNIGDDILSSAHIHIASIIFLFILYVLLYSKIVLNNIILENTSLFYRFGVFILIPCLAAALLTMSIYSFTTLFIFSSLFLGEVGDFYIKYWWWDILLHTTSTMALAIISFSIILILLNNEKIKTSPGTISIFSALIAIGIGAIWEIFEFSMDQIFGFNMQKSGLVDTMWDLIVATIGASIVSASGYLFLKFGRKDFLSHIIDKTFTINTVQKIKRKIKRKKKNSS